jgi:deoxyadenosine/deoxycytidine kinase
VSQRVSVYILQVQARPRYVAIEGPIGVGKTSLARLLVQRLGARAVVEPGPNPFAEDLWQGRAAFQAMLYSLLNRFQQKDEFHQEDLFARGGVVSDYLFACDRILAQASLSSGELALYDKVYRLLARELPRPDLVVYLQARPDVLASRLKRRVPRDYIEKVALAYADFFFNYGDSPLLVVNTSEIDFVQSRQDLDELVAVIQKTRAGVSHYSPLGSR